MKKATITLAIVFFFSVPIDSQNQPQLNLQEHAPGDCFDYSGFCVVIGGGGSG